MEFTAFDRDRGDAQLRVPAPNGPGVVDLGLAFILGHDLEGVERELEPGDYVEVVQNVDLTSVNQVGASFAVRGPAVAAPDPWYFKIFVDTTEVLSWIIESGRTRVFTAYGVNVSKLTGAHDVKYRLQYGV